MSSVMSAASTPASPGMSKHQRSWIPKSSAARRRASSTASQNASAGMPRITDEYGVRVSSA